MDRDKVAGLLLILLPVNISLFVLPRLMSLLHHITTTTRMKLLKSIFPSKHSANNRPVSAMKGKGMQLGKKTNTRLYDALSSEIASVEETTTPLATPSPASAVQESPYPTTDGIQVSFTETMSAKSNRDGGLEAMDVQGQLNLHISDTTMSRVQLGLHSSDADGTQFKTHPSVDRILFKDHHKIGLRDSSRPFPLNQQMCVLRWRLQAKPDSTKLPISGTKKFV
jgi:coatomer subunit delta